MDEFIFQSYGARERFSERFSSYDVFENTVSIYFDGSGNLISAFPSPRLIGNRNSHPPSLLFLATPPLSGIVVVEAPPTREMIGGSIIVVCAAVLLVSGSCLLQWPLHFNMFHPYFYERMRALRLAWIWGLKLRGFSGTLTVPFSHPRAFHKHVIFKK